MLSIAGFGAAGMMPCSNQEGEQQGVPKTVPKLLEFPEYMCTNSVQSKVLFRKPYLKYGNDVEMFARALATTQQLYTAEPTYRMVDGYNCSSLCHDK